jgi:hypothetical protein
MNTGMKSRQLFFNDLLVIIWPLREGNVCAA